MDVLTINVIIACRNI